MPPQSSRSSARLVAPLALAVCAVAVLAVIASSGGDGDAPRDDAPAPSGAERTTRDRGGTTTDPEPRGGSTYTVEPGDTLGGIAVKTGVPVETLQELNPELDPQALVSGQAIKLRE